MKIHCLQIIFGMFVGSFLMAATVELVRRNTVSPLTAKAEREAAAKETAKKTDDGRLFPNISEKAIDSVAADSSLTIPERVHRLRALDQMNAPKDQWRDLLLPLGVQWSGSFAVTSDLDPKFVGIVTLEGKSPWKATYVTNDGTHKEGSWRDLNQGIFFNFNDETGWWLVLEQHRAAPESLRFREFLSDRRFVFTRLTPADKEQRYSIIRPADLDMPVRTPPLRVLRPIIKRDYIWKTHD